jgi:hypothetical protein
MDEQQDDGALRVRAELDRLTAAGPPVGFTGADLVAAGRRRLRARLGVVVSSATAVGVAAAILVPSVALSRPDGPRAGSPSASRPHPTGTPTSTKPAESPAVPTVPGLSPAEARRIAAGCARSFAGASGEVPTTPTAGGGGSAQAPVSLVDTARVYNVVRDAAGTFALVYGPSVVLGCDVGGVLPYNPGGAVGDPGMPNWLAGPVAIDYTAASSGGHGGKYPDEHGYQVVGGRVRSNVARLTVTAGSDTRTVRPVNGTYLVRFVHSVNWAIPGTSIPIRVRGFDAAGRPVGPEVPTAGTTCYVLPDGSLVGGGRPKAGDHCKPALPWR